MPDFSIEEQFTDPVIGLDEVGRGPLAGPVISCGCYFKNYTTQEDFYNLIGDSKKVLFVLKYFARSSTSMLNPLSFNWIFLKYEEVIIL